MSIKQKEKGFTIIEVVLVLAIAGLIFLMVFIALPALQRSQRDTARKNDVSAVIGAVNSYVSNNRGAMPTTADLQVYVKDILSGNTDYTKVYVYSKPSTNPYSHPGTGADGAIYVYKSTVCSSTGPSKLTVKYGTTRQFTVSTRLESGNSSFFCQNS
jgi:prepilin-type N-terminal cleavage/methylation domain-containing protein